MSNDNDYNYRYNAARRRAENGDFLPTDYGLSYGDYRDLQRLAEEKHKERVEKNMQAYADAIESASHSSNEYGPANTAGSGASAGSGSAGGAGIFILIVILVIFFGQKEITCNTGYSGPYGSQQSMFDEISDPPAPEGMINIASDITVYHRKKNEQVGKFKYGIPEDSIRWFLAKSGYNKAPRKTNHASKSMVFLKNIPRHWLVMDGKNKPVKDAWFLAFSFHNYVVVDSVTYRKIRKKNFNDL